MTDCLFLYTSYLHNRMFKIKVSNSCPKWNDFSYLTCESDQYLRSPGRNETQALQVAVKEYFPSEVERFGVVMQSVYASSYTKTTQRTDIPTDTGLNFNNNNNNNNNNVRSTLRPRTHYSNLDVYTAHL